MQMHPAKEAPMSKRTILKLSPLALLLVVPLGWTSSPPPVGAPWLALEAPANPMDSDTRGAAFVVHAYYHERNVGYPVTGTAEGLVDGQRETIELDVRPTSRTGVYAVHPNWPDEGHWVLKLTPMRDDSSVTLVAELGPNGGVGEEAFFGAPSRSLAVTSIRVVTGTVSTEQVDVALRAMATASD
jgi:hypothetical protein